MIEFVPKILDIVLKPYINKFLKQKEVEAKKNLLYENINDYTLSIYNKFSKTKTFLHRNKPVDFDKIYFNISLQKIETFNEKQNDVIVGNINNFFSGNNNCVSLISFAGSGKTMLTKKIFLNSISQHADTGKIPIYLELRNINESIHKYLENIFNVNDEISKELLKTLIKEGIFIFLFDGYDEISFENKKTLTCDIEKFVDSYDKNYFLITSRPQAGIESFSRFTNYRLKNLNDKQINEFIERQLLEEKELAKKIISVIDERKTKTVINEYLKNPLLLSMFILEFRNYPEIPTKKATFYRNVYDTLCTRHDSFTKTGAYQHERESGLSNEDIERILELFSFLSFFEQKYSFNEHYLKNKLKIVKKSLKIEFDIDDLIYDLTTSISILIHDGEYKFPHRSIQEYFTTNYIKKIQKENIKNKIYQKMSLYLDSDFYNLCEEQDKIPFYKYFVIQNLEDYIKNFNAMSDDEICKKMLQGLCLGLGRDKKARVFSGGFFSKQELLINRISNAYQFSLFNFKNYDKILDCFYETKNPNLNLPFSYEIDFSKHINNPEFYNVICNIGLKDIFISHIKEIKKKIIELKEIIAAEEKQEEEILNLIN